jgi:DNA primase
MDFPKLSAQRRASLREAAGRYGDSLLNSPASEYLEGRGIPLEVAQRFQLGYVAEPLEGHDRFRGRLAIPYLTPSGPVGMRFRSLEPEGEPKYDSEAGQRTALYNVLDLHRSEPWIAVCEGELDALVMSGVVGVPAVGIPGVEHWMKKGGGSTWGRLFQDYQSVFIVMDPDKAGKKVVGEIARRVENPVVISLPADVNDTVTDKGVEYVLEQMGLD